MNEQKEKTIISYEEFEQVNIRLGTITKDEEFKRARKPAYKVWVDFGEGIGELQTSAQITVLYTPDSLIGQQVAGCINLGERNIAGFMSQFLLLGFSNEEGAICLVSTDPNGKNGTKLS